MAKFEQSEKAVQSLNKEVSNLIQNMNQLVSSVNTMAKQQSDLADKSKRVENATKAISDTEKQRLKLLEQLRQANSDSIQKNVELQLQLQKQRKTNKDLAREKLGLVGAYEKESKKLTQLRQKYKDLIVAGRGNEKATKELGKQVNLLDAKLKKADASAGQFNRNVGNYPGMMGRAQSSIMGVNQAFKALLANPIVAIIAAIAGAFIGLTKALKRSEEGQNALNKISAVLSTTLNVFLDIVTTLAENLIKAFEDPQQAVKDLWAAIKNNIVNRFEGLIELFTSLGDIGVNTFKLIRDAVTGKGTDKALQDLKASAEDAGKAFIKLQTGIEPDKLIEGFKAITKEIKEEADIAKRLADRQAALDKFERTALIKQAELRRDINQLREVAAKKEEFDAKTRLAALDEAISLENELLNINSEIVAEKADLKSAQNALGASTKEDLDEEARLRVELIELEAQASRKRKLLESERVTALREVAAEEKAILDSLVEDADSIFAEIEAEDARTQEAITKKANDEAKKRADAELAEIARVNEAKKELYATAEDAATQIVTDRVNARIDNNLNSFKESQEAQEDALKNRLDKGLITEKQYEAELKKIRLKTRQEDAKAEKKKSLFDIFINTAIAIVKALPNIPLSLVVAGIGATQAAAVAAQPIPKFRFGGKMKESGMAQFSEEGRELAVLPDGNAVLTPAKETVAFVPKGTEFFSHNSPETQAAIQGGMTEAKLDELIAIQKKSLGGKHPKTTMSLTQKGLEKFTEFNNVRTKYIDTYMRR